MDINNLKKEYSNNEITVVWQPNKCIHSAKCWRGDDGLISVFNPRNKPWININGANSEAIINKIKQCPSGALSFYFNDKKAEIRETVETETIVEQVINGPLLVYGNICIKNSEGLEIRKSNVTAFCRCGFSQNKPFCDGSHQKNDFKG
ncbi:MAG: (4Fe-4S)-binding protein [Chitinophagaceae bacterium]